MRAVVLAMAMCACGGPKDEVAEQQAAPKPAKAVPLAGDDTFDSTRSPSCMVRTLAELKKHPHWMVRVDEYSSVVPNIDAPPRLEAQILRDATGAVYYDGWSVLAKATTPLSPAAVAALDAALGLSCTDPDDGALTEGDIRWFSVGYGPGDTTAIRFAQNAAISIALRPVFDIARANHVATRAPHARTASIALAGRRWSGKAWKKWSTTIDLSSRAFSDADVVEVAAWAAAQPETLASTPGDPMIVTGTFTIDGAARPIAVSLEIRGDRWNIEWNHVAPFKPLWDLYGANFMQPFE